MTETENCILYIEDVYKSYGDKLILNDIDFKVSKGELCTLVGPSGCGKSTLLRLVLGQERATKGRILVEGAPVGFPNVERGIVFQKYSLYPHLSVLDNVLLGKRLQASFLEWRNQREEATEKAMEYLKIVRLDQHAEKFPHELSGGMCQRVAIVQALITHPKVLLMDEPFGALDPATREDAQLFLLDLWERFEMTIFFVTHDLEEAIFLGTRIFALSQYYSEGDTGSSGAKVVADYQLTRGVSSTESKNTAEFIDLENQLRKEAFDPEYLQHVSEFNLKHPDSFRSFT